MNDGQRWGGGEIHSKKSKIRSMKVKGLKPVEVGALNSDQDGISSTDLFKGFQATFSPNFLHVF